MNKDKIVERNELLSALGFSKEYLKELEIFGNSDSMPALQNDEIGLEISDTDSLSTELELVEPIQDDYVNFFITGE